MYSQTSDQNKTFIHFAGGLGVGVYSSPSLNNYINTSANLPSDQQGSSFSTASEFFITSEIRVADNWSAGIEYSYLLMSKSVNGYNGNWDFTQYVKMPGVLFHYVLMSEGAFLKVGGGFGYYFGNLSQKVSGIETVFDSHGIGLKGEGILNLAFDENFFGYIEGDVRYCLGSDYMRNGVTLSYQQNQPKMNFIVIGVKFGILYQL